MKFRRWLSLACLGAALSPALRLAATEPPLTAAWQALSDGFYEDAMQQFAAAGDSREARLGLAMAQCSRAPTTASSLDEARAQFERLAPGDDETGHAARYFLGRLQQLHPISPDATAAARIYEQLVATRADDRWCRLALVKLAVLRLTGSASPESIAAVEPLLARTADPVTQRDLHLVISEVRLHRGLVDATTLSHLQAALDEPTLPADLRADLLIQTARVALQLGDPATARARYERFIREFPKDRRLYTIQQALAHLGEPFPP
ncbi:MAG: hypothetical protein JSS11_13795 [Verrucomicrobia bacterium]|nr:hypothetical protein [Verrucomicrobiota bacterium]